MIAVLKRLGWLFLFFAVVVGLGTFWFEEIEGLNHFDAFYLTVLTITTVGYGDIVPHTVAGKWLAMGLVITGFTVFTSVVVTSTRLVFERREEIRRVQQINTLMSLFFTEIGDRLLRLLCQCDRELHDIQKIEPTEGQAWSEESFDRLAATLKKHTFGLDPEKIDWADLRTILNDPLLLRLLEDPHTFNHAEFNGLLRSAFHLRDELSAHPGPKLSAKVLNHLSGDIQTVYRPAVRLWLQHMQYMKKAYPSLFITILESNPLGVSNRV